MNQIKELFIFNLRLLFFRTTREDFDSFSTSHLKFGLFCTWIVGMGRWWDDPEANILQHLGLGSVIYIFVLSAIIWLLVLPLKARNWSYRHVLTFVSLTSLPALLYAIPVERFTTVETAITLNVWFLSIVALWRVALYFFYLARHAGLYWFDRIVVAFLPLSAIVVPLVILNLHRVVFDIMGGLRDVEKTAHDGEYGVLFVLALVSIQSLIPLLIGYLYIIRKARRSKTSFYLILI